MSLKTVGIILIIGGAIVALVFALADVIGISQMPDTFGFLQIIGTIVGVAAIIVGVVLLLRGGQPASSGPTGDE